MELFTLGLGFLYARLSAKHPLHHSYSVKPSRHSEVRTYWDTSIFTYDYIWYVTSKIQNEKIWLILIHFTTPQSDQRHLWHRVSKGPKMVLSFGRRQKLSFLSQFFLSGHIYPITQEFAWTNCILNSNSNSISLSFQNFMFLVNLTQDLDMRS